MRHRSHRWTQPTYSPTEKAWMSDVIEVATLYGFVSYHTHDSRRSAAGFPDVILVKGRYLLAVELKTDAGRVRPEQQRWLELFAGVEEVRAAVWRPRDRQRVYDDLRAFAKDADTRCGERDDGHADASPS